jgi:beta-lactamase superfamily II metal-dependent hydrolase
MQQWWGSSQLPRDVLLRIDTLSVGSGTCHIIRSGGDALLWDAGPMGTSGVLPPLLAAARALNVWRVPTLIVTHPDTDHFAGADVAMETLGVPEMITTQRTLTQAASNPRGSAAALLDAMQAGGVTVRTAALGEMLTFGNASVTFLSPPAAAPWLDAAANDNDHSLVALFEVTTSAGPRRLLMTGDIGPAAINALRDHPALASANQAHIDILELPHHGSFNEASLALALDLAPRAIIQSTGPERARDTRWAAARAASTWHSTAESGATWIQIHHDGTITSGK